MLTKENSIFFRMDNPEDNPPLPPELGQVLVKLTEMMGTIQANQHRTFAEYSRVSIRRFLKFKPSTFDASGEPLDAEHWLRDTSRILDTASVAPQDRVLFTTQLLVGDAMYWWEIYQ